MSTEVTLTVNGEITRMRLRPDDKVVVSCERTLSRDVHARIQAQVKEIFPDHQVIVVSDGFTLSVAGADDDGEGLEGLELE